MLAQSRRKLAATYDNDDDVSGLLLDMLDAVVHNKGDNGRYMADSIAAAAGKKKHFYVKVSQKAREIDVDVTETDLPPRPHHPTPVPPRQLQQLRRNFLGHRVHQQPQDEGHGTPRRMALAARAVREVRGNPRGCRRPSGSGSGSGILGARADEHAQQSERRLELSIHRMAQLVS